MKELSKIIKKNHYRFWKLNDKIIRWLRNFAILTCGLVLFTILQRIFIKSPKTEYISASYLTVITYFTTFQLLLHSDLLNISLVKPKYEKSSLSNSMKERIKSRLINYLKNDKAFLSNTFSLKQLSKDISASPNHVSQVINEDFNQSYFEFIANYRIQEAKNLLLDVNYKNKNIEEISFLVGYNSKAAFNKAFKKITGKTPLQFKKQE